LDTTSVIQRCTVHSGGYVLRPIHLRPPAMCTLFQLKCVAVLERTPIIHVNCSICLVESDCVSCSNCSSHVCFSCYSMSINASEQYFPVRCTNNCVKNGVASYIYLALPNGITGFHWNRVTGGSVSELRGYFEGFNGVSPIEKKLNDAPEFQNAFNVVHDWFKCLCPNIEIPDLGDINTFLTKFPVSGSAGFVPSVSKAAPTKKDVYTKVVSDLLMKFQLLNFMDRSSACKYLGLRLSSVSKLSPKSEVKVAERDENGIWVSKTKGRVFFIANFANYILYKLVLAQFTTVCGSRWDRNSPIAIGTKFDSGHANKLFCDLFGIDRLRLRKVVTTVHLNELEKEILKDYHVIEGDFSNYDVHLRSRVLVAAFSVFCKLYFPIPPNLYGNIDTPEKKFYLLLIRMNQMLSEKFVNAPDGTSWMRIIGMMVSGAYETSFINSVCNWIMNLTVLALIYGIELVNEGLKTGKLRFKFYGDDMILVISKNLFPNFDREKYINLMFIQFNMLIKPQNLFVHRKIFRNNGPDVPSFLKYKFFHRHCPDHGGELMYFRETDNSAGKLVGSAEKVMLPSNQLARSACMAYINCNYDVYELARRSYNFTLDYINRMDSNVSIDIDEDNYLIRKMETHGVTLTMCCNFPTYDAVCDRIGCPTSNFDDGKFVRWMDWKENEFVGHINDYEPGLADEI